MKKFAFTLAEVLITLGIIGVVAALTLPSLVANYQKKVWVNQFKKTVSTLEQGFQKMMAEDGVDQLISLSEFQVLETDYKGYDISEYSDIQKRFLKTFNIIDIGKLNSEGKYETLCQGLPDECAGDGASITIDTFDRITLADGTIMAIGFNEPYNIWVNNNKDDFFILDIAIDINGNKKPNKQGRDIFEFYVKNSGHIGFPTIASDSCINEINSGNKNEYLPLYCAQKVIEDNWEMNY